jgi:hypothetical protein
MPKFKKTIRKAEGGDFSMAEKIKARNQRHADYVLGKNKPVTMDDTMMGGLRGVLASDAIRPLPPSEYDMQQMVMDQAAKTMSIGNALPQQQPKVAPARRSPRIGPIDKGAMFGALAQRKQQDDLSNLPAPAMAPQSEPKMDAASLREISKVFKQAAKAPGAAPELAKAAGEIPKTEAGMKKFINEYGKFIALGALSGMGGKGGQIAAPIIAALPGIIEALKKKEKVVKKADGGSIREALETIYASFDKDKYAKGKLKVGKARDEDMKKAVAKESERLSPKSPFSYSRYDTKSKTWDVPMNWRDGGRPPEGPIRKFKGGSMKGKMKDGSMPQHKKMAMGKSDMPKKASGGAMRYASGGSCKGFGAAKKTKPTGPMN